MTRKRLTASAWIRPSETEAAKQMAEHRKFLVESGRRASDAYDKAVMTLAGSALGISFAFLKDIVPAPQTLILVGIGWSLLALSLLTILLSMLTSQWAIDRAIHQIDEGEASSKNAGAGYSRLTSALNISAGLLFVAGVFFLVTFALANLAWLKPTTSPGSSGSRIEHQGAQ